MTQRVAVITGASSGIGWALAHRLATEGYALGLTARRAERLEALAAELRAAGHVVAVAPADAMDRDGTLRAVHALADELGPVDLLVANAGVGLSKPVTQPNADEYEQMIRVNLLGPYYAIEAVLPAMRERGSGHLAVISSLASYISGPGSGQYAATKAALSHWMEATRLELRGTGIDCTTINPGFIQTPMTDGHAFEMPFLQPVDKAAARIARALRKRKKVYDFPKRLRFAIAVVRRLPDWARARLLPDRT